MTGDRFQAQWAEVLRSEAEIKVAKLRHDMSVIARFLDAVAGLTPRQVRDTHLEDVRRARKVALSAQDEK